jgi:hypothetical protein
MEDQEDISRGLVKGLSNKDIAASSNGKNRSFAGKSTSMSLTWDQGTEMARHAAILRS